MICDNIEATKNLVSWAEQTDIKSFVYISSVAVYGRVDGELSETSGVRNLNAYGMTKHICETVVRESEIPEKIIIQLPKMIGPYVHMEDTSGSGFLTMTKQILNGDRVVCFIPDMRYNNYLHVSELSRFLVHLLSQNSLPENQTMLVGAKEKLPMKEILQIMRDEAGSSSEIIAQCNGTVPEVSVINIEKAQMFGFSPVSAENMLRRFIREIR